MRSGITAVLTDRLREATDKGDWSLRDVLLQKLREVASSYPDDSETKKRFVIGLGHTLLDAKERDDSALRDSLRLELRDILSDETEDEDLMLVKEEMSEGGYL